MNIKAYQTSAKLRATLDQSGILPHNAFQGDFNALLRQNYEPKDYLKVILDPETDDEREYHDLYKFVYCWITWQDFPSTTTQEN